MTLEYLSVSQEVAIKLNKLCFDLPCIARFYKGKYCMNILGNLYDHNKGDISKSYISAPLFSQVQQWVFNKFNKLICSDIIFVGDEKKYWKEMNESILSVLNKDIHKLPENIIIHGVEVFETLENFVKWLDSSPIFTNGKKVMELSDEEIDATLGRIE